MGPSSGKDPDEISPDGTRVPLVMVVDNDAVILALCRRVLEKHYQMTMFSNPIQALASPDIYRADLLFTDLQMPEMGGLDLVLQARILRPDLRAAIMTGCDALEPAMLETQRRGLPILRKPFTRNHLEAFVRSQFQK